VWGIISALPYGLLASYLSILPAYVDSVAGGRNSHIFFLTMLEDRLFI